jgi:predicted DNA-binding transcriptional regulator AlpA
MPRNQVRAKGERVLPGVPKNPTAHVKPWLNVKEAAELFGVSERTLHQLRREAWFPAPHRLSTRILRWSRASLEAANIPTQVSVPEPAQLAAGRAKRAALAAK